MSRHLAFAVCLISGVLMFTMYFSQHPIAQAINIAVPIWWQIVFAFTLIIGVISFVRNNVRAVRRGHDTPYRIVAIAGVITMPLLAVIWGIGATSPFMWIFENVQVPLQATVFSLLAFFVASAAFRGFRARSVQAGLLLGAALIILISRSALGNVVGEWLPDLADWMRNYPSMSARRAILIGIGLGSLTTALRVIVGIERTWLGGAKR